MGQGQVCTALFHCNNYSKVKKLDRDWLFGKKSLGVPWTKTHKLAVELLTLHQWKYPEDGGMAFLCFLQSPQLSLGFETSRIPSPHLTQPSETYGFSSLKPSTTSSPFSSPPSLLCLRESGPLLFGGSFSVCFDSGHGGWEARPSTRNTAHFSIELFTCDWIIVGIFLSLLG